MHLYLLFVAAQLRLWPTNFNLEVGEWATIKCRMPCELVGPSGSHNFKWFVGESSNRKVDSLFGFEQRTGFRLQSETLKTCEGLSGFAINQLHVYASSVERVNRTSVQCAALRKSPTYNDYYSYFAVILVKGMYSR